MKNPEIELKNYIRNLIDRLLFIKSLNIQLKILKDWKSTKKIDALKTGRFFFKLVEYSFYRTILIELCILLDPKEEKSILDWLKKAEVHSNSFISSFKQKSYPNIISKDRELIKSKETFLYKIKTHRDKVLVHADAKYFNDPDKIYNKIQIEFKEIDDLINICSEILKKHYDIIFKSDLDLNIYSNTNIDLVLQYVFAFQKIRKDNMAKQFLPPKYIYDLLKK
jgi:hypothetical protein